MVDGFLNVYKEQGFTSFDVVAKLRGILKQKKNRTYRHTRPDGGGCAFGMPWTGDKIKRNAG